MKLNGKEVAYKEATVNDILDWCEQNGELEWLLNLVTTKTPRTRYKKIASVDEFGKEIEVEDKSQPYTVEAAPTALEIRKKFFETYFPNKLPKAKKNPTFADIVKARAIKAGIKVK